MKNFTFYWRDGKCEVLSGVTPTDALRNGGYRQGAVSALDFYSEGDTIYNWDKESREWTKSKYCH